MKRPRWSPLQILVHICAWIPLIIMLFQAQTDNLTINPIQEATKRTGNTAQILLMLSLAMTPAHMLTQYKPLLKLSRPLGLYAWMYAAIHLTIFLIIDYGGDLDLIVETIAEKRFILIGMSAFTILTILAATSFRWTMVRLGKKWKPLHRLVYLANLLVVLHFGWAMKGDLFRLQGDIIRPLLAGLAVLLLLFLRLPAVRKRLRGALREFWPRPSSVSRPG